MHDDIIPWRYPAKRELQLLKVSFCTRVIGVNDAVLENAWPWQRFYGRRRGNAECLFFTGADSSPGGSAHLGIRFDQLLVVEPPYDPELDFHYRIFNADGSERSAATVRAALPVLCA